MKHLIFGGSGFVGIHLSKKLLEAKNQKVIIADIRPPSIESQENLEYKNIDICKPVEFEKLDKLIDESTVIYHFASRQYNEEIPKFFIEKYFNEVNIQGTQNILSYCTKRSPYGTVILSTDMVYGYPTTKPVTTAHPRVPIGPYGKSKYQAEEIVTDYRKKGFNITVFRPRLILGPGRLGVLKKLFFSIKNNKLVPVIGNGNNHYQMISVFDCISAIEKAVAIKTPSKDFNLGSLNPPSVKKLLSTLIEKKKSSSKLLYVNKSIAKTLLSFLEKIKIPILHKEQYLIADCDYILDSNETVKILNWHPKHNDIDMMSEAYDYYTYQ